MTDDDARKLEAALTPLIHTAQEQVVIMMMDTQHKTTTTHYCGFLSITILSPDKNPPWQKKSHDNDDDNEDGNLDL